MMLSNKSLTIFLLLLSAICYSQHDDKSGVTDITKLTFFNPGISYEKKVGRFQTLYGQAFMNTSITIAYSQALGNMSSIYFDPAVTLQYRYYYNAGRREAREKRTEMNSLNYVAAIGETTFSKASVTSSDYAQQDRRAINRFGVAWGMQRNYLSRFSVDLNVGFGYLFAKITKLNDIGEFETRNRGQFATVGQINLGFWLNKKRS